MQREKAREKQTASNRNGAEARPSGHGAAARTLATVDRNELVRKAEAYYAGRRLRKAIREYEKILTVDPLDIEVHARIAPLYIKAGRREPAKASLQQVIACYEVQGFVEKAIAMLRLSLTVDRRDLATHLHLADLYVGKSHTGDALKLLEGSRRAFRGRRFLREAIVVEQKILTLAPDDFHAQSSLVRLLWKDGREEQAVERLRRMERQWAARQNRECWRKTRRLLWRYAPSFSTGWGCVISLFTSPAPVGTGRGGSR